MHLSAKYLKYDALNSSAAKFSIAVGITIKNVYTTNPKNMAKS